MPTDTKPYALEAKLATGNAPAAAVDTIRIEGIIDASGVQRIYLREYAGHISGMVKQGQDLIVYGPNGEILTIKNFYEVTGPKQLLLMDNQGGLVAMETTLVADGPMALYSTSVAEPAPFASLTGAGGDGGLMGAFAGGGVGAAMATVAGLGLAGAAVVIGGGDDDDGPTLPDIPGDGDGDDDDDTTAPGAPSGLSFSADGASLTGNAEPGSTVTVRDAQGNLLGTATAGSDGKFTIPLSPPLVNAEEVSVTATDAAGNVSPSASATAPDLTAPAAATDLQVGPQGDVITGKGEPGANVEVKDGNGNTIGTGTVGDDGNFSIPLDPPQVDGGDVTAVITDDAGNPSPPATATSPDLTAPAAATDLAVTPQGDVLTGKGEAGAEVEVTNAAGTVVGTGTVGDDGTFSVTLDPPQTDGGELSVVLTDAAGNPSPEATVDAPDTSPLPAIEKPALAIPAGDDYIDENELAAGIEAHVTLPAGADVGHTITVSFWSQGVFYDVDHVITASDIGNGVAVVNLGSGYVDGEWTATAFIRAPDGRVSPNADQVTYEIIAGDGSYGGGPLGQPSLAIPEAAGGVDATELADGIEARVTLGSGAAVGDKVEITIPTIGAPILVSYELTAADIANGYADVNLGSTFADGSYSASAVITASDGRVSPRSTNVTFDVDTSGSQPQPTPLGTPALSIPDAGAGVDATELADGIEARVTLPSGAEEGHTITVTLTVGGTSFDVTHVITAADLAAGYADMNLGSTYDDGNYSVVAVVSAPDGRVSPPSAPVAFEIDAVALDVANSSAALDEADLAVVGSGVIDVSGASGAVSFALSGPTGTFTSKGETITWADNNGVLEGTAGGRLVVTASIAADGTYTVNLLDSIDHAAGSNSIVLPLTVTVTDASGDASGAINLTIADDAPALAAPLSLSPTTPGVIAGTLVTDMGLDGGKLNSIEVDGMTFTADASGMVTASGTSPTILSYAINGSSVTLTTIRGETVQIDTATGAYSVDVTGREAQAVVDTDPVVGMATTGGLLGIINANLLGIIQLDTQQFYTASDANNDLVSLSLSSRALASIGGFNYNEALAAELGITVTETPWQSIGGGVLWGDVGITLTAADGGTLDNWTLNEFLGSVTLGNGVLDANLLGGLTTTATDANGNTDSLTDVTLVDLGVGAGLLEALLPDVNVYGDDTDKVHDGSNGVDGTGLDNRIYGFGGNDVLNGNLGNDLLRGGSGNDILNGGDGNDVLIGGTGVDTLTGGAGSDVFRFEKGDAFGIMNTSRDVVTDFSNASLAQGGDVLDLSHILQGEGRVGRTAGNLANYLHFEATAEGTVVHISTIGAFAGGYSVFNQIATDHRILLEGVDLTAGFANDIEIINDLLARNKLLVDVYNSTDVSQHGDLHIVGDVVDGDGDGSLTSVTIDDDFIGSPAANNAPMVGADADSWFVTGGVFGFGLATQDLLVADEDNNLASVTVDYTPLLSLNLSPLGFAYDQTLANLFGYSVDVTASGGVLGVIAPSARIVISSADGGPLDNEQINELLATVRLVDLQGGPLSSSFISANLLANMTLTAEDIWGETAEASLGSFLDINALNSIDKPLVGGASARTADLDSDLIQLPRDDADGADAVDNLLSASQLDQWLDAADDLVFGAAGDALSAGGTAFDANFAPEALATGVPPLPEDDHFQNALV